MNKCIKCKDKDQCFAAGQSWRGVDVKYIRNSSLIEQAKDCQLEEIIFSITMLDIWTETDRIVLRLLRNQLSQKVKLYQLHKKKKEMEK